MPQPDRMGRGSYIIGFAVAVCLVCSIFVSVSAVSLADLQADNKLLDRQSTILGVAGIRPEVESWEAERIKSAFTSRIVPRAIDLVTGEYTDAIDPVTYDQRKATRDPDQSRVAPPNDAQVPRLPNIGVIYEVKAERGDVVERIILPIEGKGLWSTLYGFIAFAPDLQTIEGLTYFQHGETPGLGGEVDNPRWKSRWAGRLAFDEDTGAVAISVIKGAAPPPEAAPHEVDGLAGATITARGVTHMLRLWLGAEGYGPYIAKAKAGGAGT